MIFGFLPQNLKTKAVAVAFIMSWHESGNGADRGMERLAGFRGELYCSLGTRRDVLWRPTDFVDTFIMPQPAFLCQIQTHTRPVTGTRACAESSCGCNTPR